MKQFSQRELNEARAYAMAGEQALHVHNVNLENHPVFARCSEAAHLFDQNVMRLLKTARVLGVRVIKIERRGTESQHVDLCAGPLRRAKELCVEHAEQFV
jgi:hypothetical protein